MGQNPDADVSQDEALFQKDLMKISSPSQVNRPLQNIELSTKLTAII